MSDLISRSSLIEELNTWAMQCKSIAEISILGAVVSIIENQSTVYNVDKVVEKLEECRQKYQRLCKEQGESEDEAMNIIFRGAIKIVKAGGVK